MLILDRFRPTNVRDYGKHPAYNDGEGALYPMASNSKLKHHIHSLLAKKEKSPTGRAMQYIKDKTESFDEYFPCRLKNCKLKHVKNWINFFVDYHNKGLKPIS